MSNTSCSTTSCETTAQQTEKQSECCDFHEKLLCLADEAWKELLKEKIKAQIESSSGDKLNQLAKLVASTNQQRWQAFGAEKKRQVEFKEQLKAVFLQ